MRFEIAYLAEFRHMSKRSFNSPFCRNNMATIHEFKFILKICFDHSF